MKSTGFARRIGPQTRGVRMLNNKRGNVFVMAGVVVLTSAVIIGVCLLIFGQYIIPAMADGAPYSYMLIVLLVVLAVFFFAT
jgi:hypothetical protein